MNNQIPNTLIKMSDKCLIYHNNISLKKFVGNYLSFVFLYCKDDGFGFLNS